MATTNYTIDRYSVFHNTLDNTNGLTAVINCFEGRTHRGTLYFYRDGVTAPPSQKIANGALYLRFHEARFSEVIGTLRYEKPLSLTFNDANNWGSILSGEEMIGEQEG
jgi:hypothetical protein